MKTIAKNTTPPTLAQLRESQARFGIGVKAPDEEIDVQAIFERLIANAPAPTVVDNDAALEAKLSKSNRKQLTQVCSYDRAKKLAWIILQRRCLDAGESIEDVTRRTAIMAATWENAVKWAINDPSSEYDLHKCLWIYGPPGNGKTLLLEVLHELCQALETHKVGPVIRTDEMQAAAVTGGNVVGEKKFARYSFDDMGIDMPTQHYSNIIDATSSMVFVKYERWKNAGQINCFTSNYPIDGVLDRYKDRVVSRLTQMCVPVLMKYADWRKEK
jgi:Cdc6-like AAA superfamily ATPase